MYDKPLPIIDPESAPYWAALRERRLILKHCRDCGRHHFYPRALCPHCHSDALEWSDARGTGSIYSYTVARRPAGPAFKADAPYVVAVVELDEGARMMTNIVTDDVESVRIGQRVAVAYEAVTDEITLPKFKAA
ncbi:MAG: Zn-ribbon domain-containing OB-fold protein [Burkholderiales bacterium]|nr:Zn-ribbon domain-containing OB-fold protein [Burkholderiales bacterium]